VTSIAPFHLPGFELATARWTRLADTTLEIPQLDAGAVAGVWHTLADAAAGWRERTLGERAQRLAAVAAALRSRGPGAWSEWLARSAGLSVEGLAAAWDVTFAPYDLAGLLELLRAEGLDPERRGDADWPRRIAHVLAGNVLPPTFAMLVRGWLLGAAQWLRPAGREPLFAAALAAQLRDVAPELVSTFAVLWWPHGAETEAAVLAAAEVVTAQGDDASVAALRARTPAVSSGARFCGYGDRWSVALLSRDALTPANAAGVARDVALFDQQGCLSPSLILAEECAALEEWCAALGRGLAAEERQQPRGPRSDVEQAGLRLWRESMRLGIALGTVRGFWESQGSTAWACALLAAGSALPEAALDRHIAVLPFATDAACSVALGARVERLQGVAADLRGWEPARSTALLTLLAPTRIAPPGALQFAPPAWRQDHRAPLGAWLAG
jgi:hypothetical protein